MSSSVSGRTSKRRMSPRKRTIGAWPTAKIRAEALMCSAVPNSMLISGSRGPAEFIVRNTNLHEWSHTVMVTILSLDLEKFKAVCRSLPVGHPELLAQSSTVGRFRSALRMEDTTSSIYSW